MFNDDYTKDDIKARLNTNALSVAKYFLPQGRQVGENWVCGSIAGESGQSFNLCVEGENAGLWNDFSDDGGGDIFDIIQYHIGGGFPQVMAWAKDFLNLPANTGKSDNVKLDIQPTCNKPEIAREALPEGYEYYNAKGEQVLHVVRTDLGDGNKRFTQYSPNAKGMWQATAKNTPKPYPLYNLPAVLQAHPSTTVYIHEGEKAVHAAMDAGLDGVHVTTVGGCSNPKATDFSYLAGRTVCCCRDNDKAGEKYKCEVMRLLFDAGVKEVREIMLEHQGEGDDVVEWLEAGNTNKEWRSAQRDHIIPPNKDTAVEQRPLMDMKARVEEEKVFIPDELLKMSGLVNAITDYTLEVEAHTSRALAFAGALSLVSALVGRNVTDANRTRTNLYTLAIAETGGGKEAPRRTNKNLLAPLGKTSMLADNVGSGQGIEDALMREKVLLLQMDEFDGVLKQAKGAGDSAKAGQKLQDYLLQFYSSSASTFSTRLLANGNNDNNAHQTIDQPSLSILGCSTPEAFYGSLDQSMLSKGLLNRMLIFNGPPTKRNKGIRPYIGEQSVSHEFPREITEQITALLSINPQPDGDLIIATQHKPRFVPHSMSGWARAEEYRLQFADIMDKANEENNSVVRESYVRAVENMNKIALISTCSRGASDGVFTIEPQDLDVAKNLIDYQLSFFVRHVVERIGRGDFSDAWRKIDSVFVKNCAQMMTARDMIRALHISKDKFMRHIETAVEMGYLEVRNEKAANGRSVTYICRLAKGDEPAEGEVV